MRGDFPRVPWKDLMCSNSARPKAVFIMRLKLQNRLLRADRLNKWGIQVGTVCIFCKAADETRYHIFVECDFATPLWGKLMA